MEPMETEHAPVPSDGFFDWEEMERFADEREQEEPNDDSEPEHDEQAEDEVEDAEAGELTNWKFSDFWQAPSNPSANASGVTNEEDGEEVVVEVAAAGADQPKTKHQRLQQQIQKQIVELESAAVKKRSWELGGEVEGKQRPTNSLLEVDADWETARRPAPEIAVARTESLEEMIKQRIMNEQWDDVVPQLPPKPLNAAEAPGLSQERSKVGLGELYEQEYLHKALGVPKEDEHAATRQDAQALFAKVCRKLDALSNFTFAPRPSVPDAKVTPSVAAIAMEEVIPLGVSQAEATAPEDVHAKKRGRDGLVRAEDELAQGDRKRIRAAKKSVRRKNRKAQEAAQKLASRINPGLGNPYEVRKLTETLRGASNVQTGDQVRLDSTTKDFTSSSKFFERLQKEQEQQRHQPQGPAEAPAPLRTTNTKR